MNNLPPGVSNSTYGAPWNDVEIELEVTISLGTSIPGPLLGEELDMTISEYKSEVIKEIESALSEHGAEVIEINEI